MPRARVRPVRLCESPPGTGGARTCRQRSLRSSNSLMCGERADDERRRLLLLPLRSLLRALAEPGGT